MVKAGMGFGAMLEPDLFWRSRSVGLGCCLSLREEKRSVLSAMTHKKIQCRQELFTGSELQNDDARLSFKYHLTCRPSGGRDCCSRVFPSRSSSSRAEFPGVEPDERG